LTTDAVGLTGSGGDPIAVYFRNRLGRSTTKALPITALVAMAPRRRNWRQ
jgi:hypothetical protein